MADRSVVIRLMLDSSQFEAGLNKAANATRTVGDKAGQSGARTELLASALTKVGVVAGAGVALAVKAFADFDQSMSAVAANTGATGEQLDALRQAALDAGQSTVYSASESADAINELGKAGMSTADILGGGLSGALDLAASDGMEVKDAAELMSSAMSQFSLTGKDAVSVADALAAGAGKAQGSARDLGYALSQSGTVAASYGISMQETVGALAAFAHAGILGSDAGTSLKSMLIALANPTDKSRQLMQQLGINAYDAQGNFVGLSKLAGKLKTSMSGLSQEQRNAAMATIFGSDAMRVANVLYAEGAKGVDDWTNAVSESGFAADQAAARTDNLKGDLEQLGGAFETLGIKLGSAADGPLRGLVQGITGMANAVADMPPVMQQSIMLSAAAAAGLAGLHKVFGPLITSSSAFGKAMDPIGRAAPLMATAMEQIGASFGTPLQRMETFGTAVSRSKGLMAGLRTAGDSVVSLMGGPWGVALTVAAGATMLYAQRVQEAQALTNEYADAMKNVAAGADRMSGAQGVINEKFLNADMATSTKTALDAVGMSYEDLTNALTGTTAEYDAFQRKLEDALTASDNANASTKEGTRLSGEQYQAISKLIDAGRDNVRAIQEAAGADKARKDLLDQQKDSAQGAADATGKLADETSKAADAGTILSDSFGATTKAISDQASALSEVIDAMSTYYGFSTSASDAAIAMYDSFDKANQAIAQNGAGLDLNTQKGRANQSALNDLAETALKNARAQAQNGASMGDINGILDLAREKYIAAAQAMGLTPDAAAKAADAAGLTKDKFAQLAQAAGALPKDAHINVGADTNAAYAALTSIGLAVQELPNGDVRITGDNTDALAVIAATNGIKLDPKTGVLTLDKAQFDIALALANGATIDPKTGYIKGDNSGLLAKIAEARGWKIDGKTGVISGDNGPFKAAAKAVQDTTIAGKTVKIGADTSGFWGSMNRILKSVFSVPVQTQGKGASGGLFAHGLFHPGYATGGPIVSGLMRGPGTGTSDSIVLRNARVADGEYVQRAAAVGYYGTSVMDALNAMQIPRSLFSTAYSADDTTAAGKYHANVLAMPNNSGVDASTITRAVVAALNAIPGWNLRLDNDTLAGAIAPAMDRAIAERSYRGL